MSQSRRCCAKDSLSASRAIPSSFSLDPWHVITGGILRYDNCLLTLGLQEGRRL